MKTIPTLSTWLMTVSLILGVYSAVAANLIDIQSSEEPIYEWMGVGLNTPGPFTGTRAEAIDYYGCEYGDCNCAIGINPFLPTEILRTTCPN